MAFATREKEGAARATNWLNSRRGRGIGFTEAFERTDDSGLFVPRARPSFGTFGERQGRAYSAPTAEDDSERQTYISGGREAQAFAAPILDYESEDTGVVRQTSPSPGPRDRRLSGRESRATNTYENTTAKYNFYDEPGIPINATNASENHTHNVYNETQPPAANTYEKTMNDYDFESMSLPPYKKTAPWGTKARKNREWIRKILSPDTSFELKDPVEAEPTNRPRTAPDVLLPSVEDRSLPHEPTPPTSSPASPQPMNASPKRSDNWTVDLDFTATSLQMSTSPPLRVKNTTSQLDDVRSREIQNLTARAVATNRIEEIRERNSEERSSISGSARTSTKEVAPKEEPTPEEYHEKTILEEEGEKIPFTPITVFRKKDFEDYVKRNNIAFGPPQSSSISSSKPPSRPARDETFEVLRRLSRSLSSSPAPKEEVNKEESDRVKFSEVAPSKEEAKKEDANRSDQVNVAETTREAVETDGPEPKRSDQVNAAEATREAVVTDDPDSNRSDQVNAVEAIHAAVETDGPEPKRSDQGNAAEANNAATETDDPEERIVAEARLFELQDKSERGSIRAPSPSEDGNLDETPRPKPDPLSLPTPKVTGAYIETPLIRKKTRSTSPRSKFTERQPPTRFRDSRPTLINTAKHVSAAEDLRRIQLEDDLEDSTLDDFGNFLEAEAATKGQTTTEPILDLDYNDARLPQSQKEIERRIEEVRLERMNKALKATTSSIREARKGIERLEEQVSSSFVTVPQTQPDDGYVHVNFNVNIRVPKLWTGQGWKITWFGLILLLLFSWFLLASLSGVAQRFGYDFGIPDLPAGYTGGPVSASDWWLGRDGPVGIIKPDTGGSIFNDEMIT